MEETTFRRFSQQYIDALPAQGVYFTTSKVYPLGGSFLFLQWHNVYGMVIDVCHYRKASVRWHLTIASTERG